jgi:asparagine synthase (glutamine-hydrolysing)
MWRLDGSPLEPALLVEMRDTMAHRGPDGAGCVMVSSQRLGSASTFQDGFDPEGASDSAWDVGLASRRLAIIDLVTGDQPMANEDQTVWVVFNGEIYNFRELRSQLEQRGHRFRTNSDTEVIIHSYLEYGEKCAVRFNGIFTFAIWDGRRQRLFIARDHFGVKPLYYWFDGERFSFASEIKAILADPSVPRALDLDALNLCLTFRHTPAPWTLLRDIRKLSPGCFLTVTRGGVQEGRYWEGCQEIDRATPKAEWIDRLHAGLDQAVLRQMVSDVPIGVSLSSGVDSSTILALMRKHARGPVQAFTVGFAGKEDVSEIEPARATARRFGADFHPQVITADDYADFMERYIWHLEEPIGNESAAAYYFVADMARRQGIKVLLNGQGADEAFAGYGRYFAIAYSRWLRVASLPPTRWIAPRLLRGTARGEQYERLVFASQARTEEERFLRTYAIVTDTVRDQLIGRESGAAMDADLPLAHVKSWLDRAPVGTALERMMWVDARTSLPDNLLLCEDKMAMAASVEARVPFLDVEFMKVAEAIPGRLKLRGRGDKLIHREVAARFVGTETSARAKIGFDNALDLWLRQQLGDRLLRIVEGPDSFTRAYLNPSLVRRLVQEHAARRRDHQRILFLILSLESWHSVFFQGQRAPAGVS